MSVYPFKFVPIYKERIWGGRNLHRMFNRALPPEKNIGESWELADLSEGVSVVCNGPLAGTDLTTLTARLGCELLGGARPLDNGRFPLLLKLLDANDILSLQVHPDEKAVAEIGPPAALKTECWFIMESRNGFIYKGVKPGVTPQAFREGIQNNTVEKLIRRFDVADGDFHFLPAGTVHALGSGLMVAEVQTPSDTTYRVTDWGRGREIHVERSMQCIRFDLTGDNPPGATVRTLLKTEFFAVDKVSTSHRASLPERRCSALMILKGCGQVVHDDTVEPQVRFQAGDTLLLPAGLRKPRVQAGQGGDETSAGSCEWLEITLPA